MQREGLLNLSSSLYLDYLSPNSFDTGCLTRGKPKGAAFCYCIR